MRVPRVRIVERRDGPVVGVRSRGRQRFASGGCTAGLLRGGGTRRTLSHCRRRYQRCTRECTECNAEPPCRIFHSDPPIRTPIRLRSVRKTASGRCNRAPLHPLDHANICHLCSSPLNAYSANDGSIRHIVSKRCANAALAPTYSVITKEHGMTDRPWHSRCTNSVTG